MTKSKQPSEVLQLQDYTQFLNLGHVKKMYFDEMQLFQKRDYGKFKNSFKGGNVVMFTLAVSYCRQTIRGTKLSNLFEPTKGDLHIMYEMKKGAVEDDGPWLLFVPNFIGEEFDTDGHLPKLSPVHVKKYVFTSIIRIVDIMDHGPGKHKISFWMDDMTGKEVLTFHSDKHIHDMRALVTNPWKLISHRKDICEKAMHSFAKQMRVRPKYNTGFTVFDDIMNNADNFIKIEYGKTKQLIKWLNERMLIKGFALSVWSRNTAYFVWIPQCIYIRLPYEMKMHLKLDPYKDYKDHDVGPICIDMSKVHKIVKSSDDAALMRFHFRDGLEFDSYIIMKSSFPLFEKGILHPQYMLKDVEHLADPKLLEKFCKVHRAMNFIKVFEYIFRNKFDDSSAVEQLRASRLESKTKPKSPKKLPTPPSVDSKRVNSIPHKVVKTVQKSVQDKILGPASLEKNLDKMKTEERYFPSFDREKTMVVTMYCTQENVPQLVRSLFDENKMFNHPEDTKIEVNPDILEACHNEFLKICKNPPEDSVFVPGFVSFEQMLVLAPQFDDLILLNESNQCWEFVHPDWTFGMGTFVAMCLAFWESGNIGEAQKVGLASLALRFGAKTVGGLIQQQVQKGLSIDKILSGFVEKYSKSAVSSLLKVGSTSVTSGLSSVCLVGLDCIWASKDDVMSFVKGEQSFHQTSKNVVSETSGIVYGTVVGVGVGSLTAGILAACGAGLLAPIGAGAGFAFGELLGKTVMTKIVRFFFGKDDSVAMQKVMEKCIRRLISKYLLCTSEQKQLVEILMKIADNKRSLDPEHTGRMESIKQGLSYVGIPIAGLLPLMEYSRRSNFDNRLTKEIYKASDREQFVIDLLDPVCLEIVFRREVIGKKSLSLICADIRDELNHLSISEYRKSRRASRRLPSIPKALPNIPNSVSHQKSTSTASTDQKSESKSPLSTDNSTGTLNNGRRPSKPLPLPGIANKIENYTT